MFDARRTARLDVSVHALYLGDDLVVDGTACDLSRTGAFLHAADCDGVGASGVLKVTLPTGESAAFNAKVVRIESGNRCGMALSFDATEHRGLANFLMARHASTY